ncbi:PepSY domain-containing protein [Ostreibacterium oceani]|uniref:PepSY domain-containing protein n=1 Tax=Ostreibacterium oceani TaxID=2654998 RepID=A0A6N7EXQ3_9GAMM|nr:PepSY domain-containing protein [Ostreibacterium oceani]MPV85248.1 hypothetical protein [Ostreibacterium oceani]
MKNSKHILAATLGLVILSGAATAVASDYHKKDYGDKNGHSVMHLLSEVKIDINQAMQIALDDTSGQVFGVELSKDDNRLVWEVELLTNDSIAYEYEISAIDGKILDKEIDND